MAPWMMPLLVSPLPVVLYYVTRAIRRSIERTRQQAAKKWDRASKVPGTRDSQVEHRKTLIGSNLRGYIAVAALALTTSTGCNMGPSSVEAEQAARKHLEGEGTRLAMNWCYSTFNSPPGTPSFTNNWDPEIQEVQVTSIGRKKTVPFSIGGGFYYHQKSWPVQSHIRLVCIYGLHRKALSRNYDFEVMKIGHLWVVVHY